MSDKRKNPITEPAEATPDIPNEKANVFPVAGRFYDPLAEMSRLEALRSD